MARGSLLSGILVVEHYIFQFKLLTMFLSQQQTIFASDRVFIE
jgi:hypothetical protein